MGGEIRQRIAIWHLRQSTTMFALCGCLESHWVFTTVDVVTMIAIPSYCYRSHYYKPRSAMINVTPQTSRLHNRHRPYLPTHPLALNSPNQPSPSLHPSLRRWRHKHHTLPLRHLRQRLLTTILHLLRRAVASISSSSLLI